MGLALFFVIKVEKYNEMGSLKLRTNKCTKFRRVQGGEGGLFIIKSRGECGCVKRWPLAWGEACGLPISFLWARTLSLTLVDSQEIPLLTCPRRILCWCLHPCGARKVWSHGKKIKLYVPARLCLLSVAHLTVYCADAQAAQNHLPKLFTLGKS